MIDQIIILALLVLSIHYTMQPDEIFGKFGDWLEDHLPDAIHPAVFACNVCMTPYYGSALYWLIPWQHELWQWPVIVIGAMGINVVINKWAPEKKETENINEVIPTTVMNAYEKVKNISIIQSRILHKSEWEVLFEYHNNNLGMHERPLNMNCTPCYGKVLSFIDSKMKAIGV